MRERLDPLFITSPSQRMVMVGLVIVGATVIRIPLLTSFAFDVVSLLAPIFNPVACIYVAYYVTQVSFILIPATLFGRRDAAGRVPM
jgi:hypothetical protein